MKVVGVRGQTGHNDSLGGWGAGSLMHPGTSMLQSGLGWEALQPLCVGGAVMRPLTWSCPGHVT